MTKNIFAILFFPVSLSIFGQHSIEYYSKDWVKTKKNNSYFIRKIDSLDNGLYFVTDSSIDGKMFKSGYYKSLNPEIEHGEFYYCFRNYKRIYKGQYTNGEMSGLWFILDKKGKPIDTLDYNFELIKVKTETLNNSNDGLNDDGEFMIVEKMPKFGKGPDDFRKYIADNLYYPPRATMYGIKGKVYIQFTIDTTGQVVDINIVISVDKDIDKESIRVVHNSQKWKPGELRGKPVRVQFTIPLNFTFDD